MLCLVLSNLLNVLFRPAPVFASIHSNLLRGPNLAGSHPPVQCHPMNASFPGRLLRRICLHLRYTSLAKVVKYKIASTGPLPKVALPPSRRLSQSITESSVWPYVPTPACYGHIVAALAVPNPAGKKKSVAHGRIMFDFGWHPSNTKSVPWLSSVWKLSFEDPVSCSNAQ